MEPNTASTDGPRTTAVLTHPMMLPIIISHPVMNPSDGLMERPTHSNAAPQLAFHMLSLRYALAMISMGIAVRMITGPDA